MQSIEVRSSGKLRPAAVTMSAADTAEDGTLAEDHHSDIENSAQGGKYAVTRGAISLFPIESTLEQNEDSHGTQEQVSSVGGVDSVPVGSNKVQSGNAVPRIEPQSTHGIVPQLRNVVATALVGVKIDLRLLARKARNCEYKPSRFAAAIMRIREPRTTALIFASGKIVVTGAKSESQSRLASRKFAKVVYKCGFDKARFNNFKIHNLVATCSLSFRVNLVRFAHSQAHYKFIQFEPELFPALVYRMLSPKVTLLVFANGRVVVQGAKLREEIDVAFSNIYPVLQQFQKTDED